MGLARKVPASQPKQVLLGLWVLSGSSTLTFALPSLAKSLPPSCTFTFYLELVPFFCLVPCAHWHSDELPLYTVHYFSHFNNLFKTEIFRHLHMFWNRMIQNLI